MAAPRFNAGQSLNKLLVGNLLGGATTGQAAQASTNAPPPSGGTAPASSPVSGARGGGGRKSSPPPGLGSFNPGSNFGLNLKSKLGFDPFAAPQTQGDFNRMLLEAAQSQYMPQLQSLRTQESAENNAFGQRNKDIGSIYDQYNTQAQDAYNQLKSDLAAIQAQVAPGSVEANLGAALQSAVGGSNSLATMMGQSTQDPSAAALPYLGASEAQQAALQQLANSGESAATQAGAGNVQRVGNERATELNTESLRHQGALTGYGQQEQQLAAQIPGIIEKERENLIQQLQSGENLKTQQNLAEQQFGLQKTAQQQQNKLDQQKFLETQKVDTANINQGRRQLDQNQQKIIDDENATQTAAATALAQAQGAAQVNAVKYLQSALTPTADMYKEVNVYAPATLPNGTPNPDAGKKIGVQKVLANPKAWHVDVGSILKTIMTQYGLPLNQALQMMSSIGGRVYISGQGGQTVADWANTYHQRLNNPNYGKKQVGKAVSGGVGNIIGNLFK